MSTINHKLVEIALEHVDGSSFEKFFQTFYSALMGTEFVPLGGTHDGGADAFQNTVVHEAGDARTFYQASIQEDHRSKIRHTVKRLRQFGRDPATLIYATSRNVGTLDRDEDELSKELRIFLRIRNRQWFITNINANAQTIEAFNSFLSPHISFLSEVGGANIIKPPVSFPERSVVVFLGQEIDRRRGKSHLLESVTDTLILWALEGTDPDKASGIPSFLFSL